MINEKQGKALLGLLEALGLSLLVPDSMTFGAAAEAEKEAAKGKSGKEKNGKEKVKAGKKEKVVEKEESSGVKLTFSFVSLTKSGKQIYEYMRISEDPIEFQLRVSTSFLSLSLLLVQRELIVVYVLVYGRVHGSISRQ